MALTTLRVLAAGCCLLGLLSAGELTGAQPTVTQVREGSFELEVARSDLPVVLDAYAQWCGPCKQMAPAFEAASREWQGKVKFVKLDVDQDRALAKQLGVSRMPTLIFFKGGKPVGTHVGLLSKEDLGKKIGEFFE